MSVNSICNPAYRLSETMSQSAALPYPSTESGSVRQLTVLHLMLLGDIGGIEAHVRDLAYGQRKEGMRVEVVCCLRGGIISDHLKENGIPVYECGVASGHDPRLPSRLKGVLERVDPDIIHLHSLPFFGMPAVRKSRALIVHTFHLAGMDIKTRINMKLYGQAVKGVIAVSDGVFDSLKSYGIFPDARWGIIPLGVDLRRFEPRLRAGVNTASPVLCSVGRMEPDKHVEEAIKALSLLRTRGLDAELWLIGSGNRIPYLKAKAAHLGIEDKVRFWGAVQDTSELLRHADLLLLTSEAETFGLAAIEAMATGIPVIAYPMKGGINSWIHDESGAFVSHSRNPEALADAIQHVIESPADYARLSRQGLDAAARFSMDTMVERTLDFYTELLALAR